MKVFVIATRRGFYLDRMIEASQVFEIPDGDLPLVKNWTEEASPDAVTLHHVAQMEPGQFSGPLPSREREREQEELPVRDSSAFDLSQPHNLVDQIVSRVRTLQAQVAGLTTRDKSREAEMIQLKVRIARLEEARDAAKPRVVGRIPRSTTNDAA